jgi:hypothetical protein
MQRVDIAHGCTLHLYNVHLDGDPRAPPSGQRLA